MAARRVSATTTEGQTQLLLTMGKRCGAIISPSLPLGMPNAATPPKQMTSTLRALAPLSSSTQPLTKHFRRLRQPRHRRFLGVRARNHSQ